MITTYKLVKENITLNLSSPHVKTPSNYRPYFIPVRDVSSFPSQTDEEFVISPLLHGTFACSLVQNGGTKTELPFPGTPFSFSEEVTCSFSLTILTLSSFLSIPKAMSTAFWKASNSEVISGLLSSSICCLALFLACVKEGGSCSSSRSIFWNSSMVSWLEGVSWKSPNLFLMVDSLIRTTRTTSRTVLLNPCNLAETKRAVKD